MKKKKFKTLDLFAGIGGIRLGFEKAGFKSVYANDFDKYWPEVERDIGRLEAESIFRPSRYLLDIGERLNSSFDWKNGKGRVKAGSLLYISKENKLYSMSKISKKSCE